jgi:hypothetical protein
LARKCLQSLKASIKTESSPALLSADYSDWKSYDSVKPPEIRPQARDTYGNRVSDELKTLIAAAGDRFIARRRCEKLARHA